MPLDPTPRISLVVQLPGTPDAPVPPSPGRALTTVLTRLSADDPVDVHVALAAEPRQEDVMSFLGLCAQVAPDLSSLVSCSLVGPEESTTLGAVAVLADDAASAVPQTQLSSAAEQMRRERLLRDLRRRPLRAGRPLQLLVLAQHIDSWPALEPLVRAAHADPRVECTTVALEGPFSRTPTEAFDAVAAVGWDPVPAASVVGKLDAFDVIVVCDPYDSYRPEGWRLADFLAAGVRVVLSPYAVNITSEMAMHHDELTHNLAWRIYAADEVQLALFGEHCSSGNDHVRALGSVKQDWLTEGIHRAAAEGAALKDRLGTERVALWNPHFRVGNGQSTFVEYADALLQVVTDDETLGLIARPHPMLLPQLESKGPGGQEFVHWFRQQCELHPRVVLDEDRDYRPAFAASTCLVSDLSSIMSEYLCLQKPVAYLRHPTFHQTASDAAWRDRVVTVDDVEQLRAFLAHRSGAAPVSMPAPTPAGVRVVDDVVRSLAEEVKAFW